MTKFSSLYQNLVSRTRSYHSGATHKTTTTTCTLQEAGVCALVVRGGQLHTATDITTGTAMHTLVHLLSLTRRTGHRQRRRLHSVFFS